MRIVCLTETLLDPQRFCLAIWDSDAGCYVEGGGWVVHATTDKRMIVDRLQSALRHFVAKGCGGVTTEIHQMFKTGGVSLPEEWKSYDARKQ